METVRVVLLTLICASAAVALVGLACLANARADDLRSERVVACKSIGDEEVRALCISGARG